MTNVVNTREPETLMDVLNNHIDELFEATLEEDFDKVFNQVIVDLEAFKMALMYNYRIVEGDVE